MRSLLKLAWRDIWRNRRRSLLTMGAILFAVVLITMANSVQYGTYDAMEELVVRIYTSDIQVHRTGFQEERTLEHSLEEDEVVLEELQDRYPWITALSRRLTGYGLASSDSSSAGVMIIGVEPEQERAVSRFAHAWDAGHNLEEGDRGSVLLGVTLAKNLSVQAGDSVVVLTQGYRNVMGAEIYAVKGLIRTGSPDVDRGMMVMTLGAAQDLFTMEGRYTELVLRTDAYGKAPSYASAIASGLDSDQLEVMSWRAILPELGQMRKLDDTGNYIFYLFLVLLIGFEIFNTTTMSMMERVREFGVMMSIGLKPRQISLLVALELFLKVILALLAGLLVTIALVALLSQDPIPLSANMTAAYEDFGFIVDGIYFSGRPVIFIFPVVSVAVVALLSMVYPILKMRRFSPVQALRTT